VTFLDALKTGSPMRQRSWVKDLRIEWSIPLRRWLVRSGSGETYNVEPLAGVQGVLTPATMLADDWEIQP